jgi:hypothetical protein
MPPYLFVVVVDYKTEYIGTCLLRNPNRYGVSVSDRFSFK